MGYKVWMLCGRDGCPYHLNIHQGKESERAPHSERVVTRLMDDGHCQLLISDTLKKLSDLNVRATGTVRLNRSGTTSEMLTSNKELMKLRRNLYDCSCDGKVYIVRWHDKAVVTVASNCWQTYSRLHTMNQQVAFQRKDVKHTHLIQAYNSGMGDTYCCSTSY
ncbi:PiggyBac transposable element-derived protein 3 [Trichinella sp. T9]|nr:PiggyBac transposable element-derived protein 3 [Trichinella sp. T9]